LQRCGRGQRCRQFLIQLRQTDPVESDQINYPRVFVSACNVLEIVERCLLKMGKMAHLQLCPSLHRQPLQFGNNRFQ
jgi:hypothetical protein